MMGDKQAECHNRVPFYGLRMIIFSRLSAFVSPKNSYLCSVRGTFFLLKTDKYSEFTSVILWNSVRCKSCSPRVCSTKTRIKTELFHTFKAKNLAPRVCSTKTRIKTRTMSTLWMRWPLREYVPLKQGLRQLLQNFSCNFLLREYVPLKQGLRLGVLKFFHIRKISPRVCSTKTRIKTSCQLHFPGFDLFSESMFH